MRNLIEGVVSWGYNRGILTDYKDYELNSIRMAQFKKTEEEVEELCDAIDRGNREEAIDAIGDIIVTLIMQAELWNTDIEYCLAEAYGVISKRSGKMVDGQFVKDTE